MNLKSCRILVSPTSYGKTEKRLLTELEDLVGEVIYNPTGKPCGGSTDGLDIARFIAFGTTLGDMVGQFLKAATVSTEKVVEVKKLMQKQIELTRLRQELEIWKV
jgi:isopentenyl diphosphate isomerase/L-lactate dehydrogenase-like FMN-dependent dehydrogenase